MSQQPARPVRDRPPRPDRRLAHLVPDEPGWIDLRGALLSGHCKIFAGADVARGFVLRSTDFPFGYVWGEPPRQALRRAVEGTVRNPEFRLLADPAAAERLAAELPGWRREETILHRWSGETPTVSVPEGVTVEIYGGEDAEGGEGGEAGGERDEAAERLRERTPADLRSEIDLALRRRCPMTVAWTGDASGEAEPASFCYAALRTETWWDVAVDTVESHRRRGLAMTVFDALRRHLAPQGLTPVWGAYGHNIASLRLAARLGFEEDARRVAFAPPAVEPG